jgi:hypothetical protein
MHMHETFVFISFKLAILTNAFIFRKTATHTYLGQAPRLPVASKTGQPGSSVTLS